jgi:hypothetical protein
MSKEIGEFENETQKILSESFDAVYQDEDVVEEKEEVNIEEDNKDNVSEETEETTEESLEVEEDESTEEVEDVNETEEKEVDLKESLRGVFNNEYIDLLESVDDLDLRSKLIDAGKVQRADLDRKRLELGESNKLVNVIDEAVKSNGLDYNKQQYAQVVKNFMDFDALYSKDPKQAIESLAKQANIDLTSFGSKTVQQSDDFDDYRTPEEIARDEKLEALERKVNQYENQQKQQDQISVQQEINNFANTRDDQGNLKYPHFERVRANMGLFFNDSNPNMTMADAYQKAIRLDDELFEQTKSEVLVREEQKRKAEIEKAKKLKKQSVRSSKVKSVSQSPRKNLESIVDKLGFG